MRGIPDILDVTLHRGARADAARPPDLVIEVPHGATRTADYDALARRLESPLPPSLVDFFHVNTDTGAPELGDAIAARFVDENATRSALVVRCRIPRTFIDCNRVIDAAPEEFKAGKVTPGLMPWITAPADRELLRGRYQQYVDGVRALVEPSMPAGGLLLLHSYAPRTVDVEVDARIVETLHDAYRPEVEPTWPLRPEVDVIGRGADGTSHRPAAVFGALVEELGRLGVPVADSATYPMHASTIAYHHVVRWPGRVLCVEVRRDLLADPWTPFAEMSIGRAKVDRLAAPMARAVARWFV